MRLASLPMYDLPEVRAATDAWWAGLAGHFRDQGLDEVPEALERGGDWQGIWREPGLLFSQTCGYPLMTQLAGAVRVVATPAYALETCAAGHYCSVLVVRADDPAETLAELRGRTAAVNSHESQSGYNVLRYMLAPLAEGRPFLRNVVVSGGHAASLAAVAEGEADVAATDGVTFALLRRYRPDALEGLRVLTQSPTAPGLPYVTAAATSDDELAKLRAGLAAACADDALSAVREALLLRGVEVFPEGAYGRILDMETEAKSLKYSEIC